MKATEENKLIAPCDVCYGDGLVHSIDEDGEEEIQKCDHCDVFQTDAEAKEFIKLYNKPYITCDRCCYDLEDEDGEIGEHYCIDDKLYTPNKKKNDENS